MAWKQATAAYFKVSENFKISYTRYRFSVKAENKPTGS
jgi:hypothetical protein